MTEYLAFDELLRLQRAIGDLVDDYLDARPAIVAALPGSFRALIRRMPDSAGQLIADTNKLNTTERLADGRVPFILVLKTILAGYGAANAAAAAIVAQKIDEIAGVSSGAAPIAAPTADEIKEAVIQQNDMLPVDFLRLALQASAAVAKLSVRRFDNGVAAKNGDGTPVIFLGTGWLIAKGVLITNHHVVNARLRGEAISAATADLERQAKSTKIEFDFDGGAAAPVQVEAVELIHADRRLDYAALRIQSGDRRAVSLAANLPEVPDGHAAAAVNIIQHPYGEPKRIAVRNNLIASQTAEDLRYFTDTDGGSSGSPVFNDGWEVVALHRGSAAAAGTFQGNATTKINVGTRLSALMGDLRTAAAGSIPEPRRIVARPGARADDAQR